MTLLYVMVFIVYWCYGTQLSVNGSATADFWGTKNAGINYGMLFTAWGVAGIIGPRIAGVLFDKYKNYQMAFYTAASSGGGGAGSRINGAPAKACVAVKNEMLTLGRLKPPQGSFHRAPVGVHFQHSARLEGAFSLWVPQQS